MSRFFGLVLFTSVTVGFLIGSCDAASQRPILRTAEQEAIDHFSDFYPTGAGQSLPNLSAPVFSKKYAVLCNAPWSFYRLSQAIYAHIAVSLAQDYCTNLAPGRPARVISAIAQLGVANVAILIDRNLPEQPGWIMLDMLRN